MKVILLQSVAKVGKKGDVVDVSDGYAANALLPTKKAIIATAKNLEAHNRTLASVQATKALEHGLLEAAIRSLPNMTLTLKARANAQGHLFSKVDTKAIVEALALHRISVGEKNILLKESIKSIGTYIATIKEGEYTQTISIDIVAQ